VRLTIDSEARDLLERARALASHRLPSGGVASLFKLAMRSLVRELEKERFGIGRRPRIRRANAQAGKHESESADRLTPSESPPPGGSAEGRHPRSRRVAADVMRALYARDQCRRTFVSQDGKHCEARHFLEIDHVKPWARNGASTIDNLRLRCRAHNQLHARQQFGGAYVDAAVTRARRDPRRNIAER